MTCSTVSSIKCARHEMSATSPRSCCHSPSSISDVDFSGRAMNSSSVANDKLQVHVRRDAESGDELEQPEASTGNPALASGSVDINEVLAHRVSSSSLIKRQAAADEDPDQATGDDPPRKKLKSDNNLSMVLSEAADSDYLPSDYEEGDSFECSVSRGYDCTAVGGCESVELDVTADVACSSESTRRRSRRTLYIEYWSRTGECKERKWDHLDEIAKTYGSAEDHIFATTLKGRTAFLEPNMFPYDTPAGIEHWTLWHVKDLNHEQVKQYVESWIDANASHVDRWNYDDNPERSIDIFHVHVYLQVAGESTVLQERKVDDLVHELD
uniref:Chromo domain-containing protein n=1 Tax=Peronospora matthiolae TaxID=2874970 RepID=A0AAV1U656_9STRA